MVAMRVTPSTPTVYIVGAGGQLGTALQERTAQAPDSVVWRPLTSADIDITDETSVAAALGDLGAGDVVVNCAAYTDVDGAESDPEGARRVNVTGPALLAAQTAAAGAWLIHVSTDYVFPGTPLDGPGSAGDRPDGYEPDDVSGEPATVYGATKLAGERAALDADPRATVVRTAWVYTGGPESRDFVGTMRRLEQTRDTVSVVDDQLGSPTYCIDLADGLWELVAAGPRPEVTGTVLHATNAGRATWFEVAAAVFEEVGAERSRVLPTTTAEFRRPAPRPAYSVLSGRSWAAAGLTPLRDWRAALHASIVEPGGSLP
ncbi:MULTISPECIES: dTDP-4-dehydrorhamnose reductase [Gordonia]|uniref:dTDP-4-dehydrorhamnose reductase n=1 Tax=Gordonia amicalis TaxID=89053 RepID=A0AAE4U075_9ACTN|nr:MULTISPECIES: dTDP-4-dehydrorhamnose reductase [Gordonia]KAF0968720.1 dTDP-4-dehydrorhamnose reductase [Gordonia sp. YY1]MBA5847090.1 dTDP-4-dehydrorhamnose reductase [Gordonia amicalis]MCZ4652035.1 dTDP-4-dehydrorhamnose reductase [Gordonia amicalis]MDJ0452821.1 dTDP-4-dehydrorhamnose reductase [Gordonia amicalis]MDV6308866.1 dTDP-4-dehydrorhamnose reductase [Gordonia amicalis]